MSKPIIILLAGAVSCALFMVLHAASWIRIFGKRPRPPWTYVAGILGLAGPFTAGVALWGSWWAWGLAVSVVAGAGAAVIFGYKVRGQGPILLEESRGQEEIIRALRAQVAERDRKLMALEGGRECPTKRTKDRRLKT